MTDQPIAPVRQDLMPCIPPSDWEFFTVVDTENGLAVYRDELPGRAVVRRRVTYGDWEPVHPNRWAPELPTEGDHGIAAAPTPPQDGPHAPQDAPQRPDAGAETPDGAGGRQAGTEPLARLRRLRTQLAAEHAKAVRADQHPRPDLDHLRVTPHNGIAAGLETALFFIDHHLREAGEQPARTTANNGAGSGDAVDNCCVCGGGPVVYRNFLERPFCWACADCQCGENPCVRTGINDPAVSGEAALRAALREALACLYTLTRVGGSVIGYQTVNVIPPAMYDRWQAVLQAAALDGKEQP